MNDGAEVFDSEMLIDESASALGVSLDIENYCTIRASRHVNAGIQGFCLLFSKNKATVLNDKIMARHDDTIRPILRSF